jgi:hypothetical protein
VSLPTPDALRRHPRAVVLVAAPVESMYQIDYDFEAPEFGLTLDQVYADLLGWAEYDSWYGDRVLLVVEVLDTSTIPITLGRHAVVAGGADGDVLPCASAWAQEFIVNPDLLLSPDHSAGKHLAGLGA